MNKALITGITGQDGSYLAELLLDKGYEVDGIMRRASTFNTERINHLYQDPHINGVRLFLHYGDIADSTNLIKLLYRIQPDEIYHLAAQSHVRVSFDIPEYTGDVSGLGTIRILEAIRETGLKSKFYQASSSEMYGKVQAVPQRENTPFIRDGRRVAVESRWALDPKGHSRQVIEINARSNDFSKAFDAKQAGQKILTVLLTVMADPLSQFNRLLPVC